jgi:uncharacterized repeat protein (TIGR01451 family)
VADLAITKTDNESSAVPGTSTTYTIVVSNAGPSAVTEASVSDPLPAGAASATWRTTGSSGGGMVIGPSSGTDGLTTTVDLPVGATVTFTFTVQINPSATESLTNIAHVAPPPGVTDPNPDNNITSDTDTLTPTADLSITKSDGVPSAVPGLSTTYTIVVSNTGPSAVTGASVSDALPVGVTSASWRTTASSGSGTVSGPTSGTGALAAMVNLPVHATVTFTFTVQIDPSATGSLINTATITPPQGVTDPTPGDNSATDTDTLTPRADLAITKTDNQTAAVPGLTTTYTIVVSNAGPSAVIGASVSDPLPLGVTAARWTATASSGGGNVTGPLSGGDALATTVDLPVNASVTFTFTVQIDSNATGTLKNTATVTPPPGTTDPNGGNNSASDTDTLTPHADLIISKTDNTLSAVPGSSTTYIIVVRNAGASAVTGASVSDPLPAHIIAATWTETASSGGGRVTGPTSGTGALTTTVDLPAGATVTFTFTAQIDPSATGFLVNTITVTPPPGVTETNPVDNKDADTNRLTPKADVSLTKVPDQSQVMFGLNVNYTLTVHNHGPSTATGVFVYDPLPMGLGFVSAAPSQGTFDPVSDLWSVGTLANGAAATLQLTVVFSAIGPVANSAEAGADQLDPDLSNNLATATVTGTNPASNISKKDFLASSDPDPAGLTDPTLDLPAATVPAGIVTTTRPTFTWTAVNGAATYKLWLEDLRTGQITLTTNLTGTSYTPTQPLLVGDSYSWYAGAVILDNQVTVWSAAQTFSIAPIAESPASTITNQLPTFNWTGQTSGTSYWLWIRDQSTGTVVVSQQNLTGNSYTLTSGLTPGDTFTWWIGAAGSGGTTIWSAGQNFSIAALPAPSISGAAGTIGSTTPTFSWTAVSGAGSYSFWLRDKVTNQIVSVSNLSGTSFVPAQLLTPGDSYIWYAAAVSTNGLATVWSAPQTFTIAPIALGPTGTIGTPTPTFNWTTIKGAASYTVWIQDQASGQVTTYKNLTGTSYTPATALTLGDTYTWYAGAVTPQGNTVWSAPQSFSIVPAATGPTGTIGTTTPNFTWTALTGAVSYKVWLQDEITGQITTYTNLTTTSDMPGKALTPGHSYTWYAGAVTGQGTIIWSAAQSFTIAPVAISPAGTVSSQFPTFTWAGVTGTPSYWLWVSDRTTGTVVVSQQNLASNNYTPTTALTPGHNFTWWIGAAGGSAIVWSTGQDFSIAPLAAPALSGVAGTIGSTTPTFSWSAVGGAGSYKFWLQDQVTGQIMSVANLAGTSYTPAQPLLVGDSYIWYAAAVSFNGSATVWSAGQNFTIAPVAAGPAGTITSQLPTFAWAGVTGVNSYWLWVSDQNTGAVVVSQQNLTGTSYTPTMALTPGHSFTWWIGAASGKATVWSAAQTFSIAALMAPVLRGPGGTISGTTPTFSWNAVTGADHYDLWINNLTTGVGQIVRNKDVTATSLTLSVAQALQLGDKYVWWVAAVSANGLVEVWSQSLQFTVTL